ncbi:riboflavin kinase [uncultured Bifidobacterium sp.]|uniref:riboflavin kinase n=1 Tax=uncultured Bifidobacterium sp. TaxID=165187 RepID=UPI00262E7344|nr:riboflavin kinase [uncultured Bifidobacterium sp.]
MIVTRLEPDSKGDVEWPVISRDRRSVLTVGVFDGMHSGHRAVVKRLVEKAHELSCLSIVVMFDPRPGFVHSYAKAHDGRDPEVGYVDGDLVTSLDQRLAVLRDYGVDHVLVVRYTVAFSSKSYVFFLGQMVGRLGMRRLVLGSDAVMGSNRAGTVASIADLAASTGVFELDVVDDRGPGYVRIPRDVVEPRWTSSGEPRDPTAGMTRAELRAWSKIHQARRVRVWSSTNVRYLLSQGRVREANDILGSAHGVESTIVHGERRGRTLGFPTANLSDDVDGYIPADGVYAGWIIDYGPAGDANGAEGDDISQGSGTRMGERRWPAAISIGTKPTYSEKTGIHSRALEVYAITDEWVDLYDHRVRVEFLEYLRPQIRFDSSDDLIAEMRRNVVQTLEVTRADHDASAKDSAKGQAV